MSLAPNCHSPAAILSCLLLIILYCGITPIFLLLLSSYHMLNNLTSLSDFIFNGLRAALYCFTIDFLDGFQNSRQFQLKSKLYPNQRQM